MFYYDADVHPGWEGPEGGAGQWWQGNVGDPEVVGVDAVWRMYVQVQIDAGQPIDIAGQVAQYSGDRIMLLTSGTCSKPWTRKTDRGVITNVQYPTRTAFHHHEVIYVPWDTDGKPWWMYVAVNIDNTMQGYYRIKSNDPTTFDYNQKQVAGLAQLGNQIGYLKQAAGGPLFIRITFSGDSTGRQVPSMQFSRDGLTWFWGDNGPVLLDGSKDNVNNKNCYFLGMSTLWGTGEIEYLGNQQWKMHYAATTCNTPVAPEIYYAEIGAGDMTLTVTPSMNPAKKIQINSDAAATTSRTASLTIWAGETTNGVHQMALSNDGVSWGAWESYKITKSWTLTSGDGTKTVYVLFKDTLGNQLGPYSDSIILDTTVPTAGVSINSAAVYTTTPSVTLSVSGSDSGSGVSQMRFYNAGSTWSAWEPFNTTKTWTLPSVDGLRTVYAQVKDAVGWFSSTVSDTIALGTPVTVVGAKVGPAGSKAILDDKVVTAVFTDGAYVQEAEGYGGIRVTGLSGVAAGDLLDIYGSTQINSSEKTIQQTLWKKVGTGVTSPKLMPNLSLGGEAFLYDGPVGAGQKGIFDGSGLNTVGMLVKVYGEVTSSSLGSFAIDDGSGREVHVLASGYSLPVGGQYVTVTGISSFVISGTDLHRAIRVRKQADIAVLR